MGGAIVYRERVSLRDLPELVRKERFEAEKIYLYLRAIYLKPLSAFSSLYDITLEFEK